MGMIPSVIGYRSGIGSSEPPAIRFDVLDRWNYWNNWNGLVPVVPKVPIVPKI
jgi:hypothetical protein